jgi:hypothetical protein
MSTSFPHVNLAALKKFAATTAAAEHPSKGNSTKSKKANPQITSCEDVVWAGEKVRHTRISELRFLDGYTDDPYHF